MQECGSSTRLSREPHRPQPPSGTSGRGGNDESLGTEVPLDAEALAGRENLILRFQSQPGHGVPPVADLRVVAAE